MAPTLAPTNGAEAVLEVTAWRPHLVLLDMSMPVMDGYAAARAIRSGPAGRSTVIVTLTANAFEEERSAMLEAGAAATLCKPCLESDLLEEIRKQLGLRYTYAYPASPERTSAPPSLAPHAVAPRLPRELRAALQEAARVADFDEVLALVGQFPDEQAPLGEEIRQRVEAYDYEGVERLLREG